MKVPETCGKCLLVGWHYVFDCRFDECDTRMQSCPLVEVKPHGRLIDADSLALTMNMDCPRVEYEDLVKAPTIIEAEGDE